MNDDECVGNRRSDTMDLSESITLFSLAVSATALGGAVFLHLAHETRDVPRQQRASAMVTVAWGGVRRVLPSRHTVVVMGAGICAFVATSLICCVGFFALLLWYSSTLPNAGDNVIVGAAQVGILGIFALWGLGLAFMIGLVSGIGFGFYVSGRIVRPSE